MIEAWCSVTFSKGYSSCVALLFGVAIAFSACKKDGDEGGRGRPSGMGSERQEIAAPAAPGEKPSKAPARCQPTQDHPPLVISADTEPNSGSAARAVEFSHAVALREGFAVGILRGDQAEVVLVRKGGAMKVVSLGTVHGGVPAPVVAAREDRVVAAVSDSDAGSLTVRLARISSVLSSEPKLSWGPEVRQGRGESAGVSLQLLPSGEGLLVWDRFDRATLRSRILSLPFDVETMKGHGALAVVSPRGEDCDLPQLVARPGGFWLLSVCYELPDAEQQEADQTDLVEEPPRRLWAVPLGKEGQAKGSPSAVTLDPSAALVFDAAPSTESQLLVAYREVPVGRPLGEHPIQLAWVGLDGAVRRSQVVAESGLGPGAPLVMGGGAMGSEEPAWLVAGGVGASMLLARSREGEVKLLAEPGLFAKIPLARAGESLLAARPRGLDIDLEFLHCSWSEADPSGM